MDHGAMGNALKLKYSFLALFIFVPFLLQSQDKKSIQIKTFDQQLKPLPNLFVSINGSDFIPINNKGSAFAELPEKALPPEKIAIKDDALEAESWNYRKGILEIIIRKKDYRLATFTILTDKGEKVPGNLDVTFYGDRSTIDVASNKNSTFKVPASLNENFNENKFSIKGYSVKKIDEKEGIIYVEPLEEISQKKPSKKNRNKRSQKNDPYAELDDLDNIKTLQAFYNVVKNYRVRDLDDELRQKLDIKFHELVKHFQDSLNGRKQQKYIDKISEITLINTDLQNLLKEALEESRALDSLQKQFEEKLEVITAKLNDGSKLPDSVRRKLLNSIDSLEAVLANNREKFQEHQENYRTALASLREKLSDIDYLQKELTQSEAERAAERKAFQQRMLTISSLTAGFALLAVFLFYFIRQLKRQQKELVVANNKIKVMNENLEELIKERTRSLESANQEMDTFLYRASHDLRRPISSILGLSNIAKISLSNEGRELFEKTTQTAYEMDKILRKLQAVSEINHPADYSTISFSVQVENIRRTFSQLISEHNISFRTDIQNNLTFRSYPRLIEIILFNLIENALFYSLLKKEHTPEIEVKARKTDGIVEFSVFDNGVGIDPSIRDRLWDMFFIGNERSKGNGLGLYLVHKSVEALKGKITFESEPYTFTRFIVTIPASNGNINNY